MRHACQRSGRHDIQKISSPRKRFVLDSQASLVSIQALHVLRLCSSVVYIYVALPRKRLIRSNSTDEPFRGTATYQIHQEQFQTYISFHFCYQPYLLFKFPLLPFAKVRFCYWRNQGPKCQLPFKQQKYSPQLS